MDEAILMQSVKGHRVRNAQLAAKLKEKGIDFSEKRSIEFHFYSDTQKNAALLARHLYGDGFIILLLAPAARNNDPAKAWAVEAGLIASVEQAIDDQMTVKLAKIAANYRGFFDGWGTSV